MYPYSLIKLSNIVTTYVLFIQDVIDEARIATATVIWSVLPNASYVSIVTFSTMASTRKPVTKIVSDTTRRELIARLPTSTSGSTSIGAGLQECKSVN